MKRNTKSALLLSVVSIIVCCTMLLGTTMAWFTDSVTSAKNVIVAGNLDVELYHDSIDDANKINDETNLFNDVALWEPGAVVYENIIVANAGNLALKYQLTLSGLEATEITLADGTIATLMDVIKVGIVEDGFTATDANVDDRTEAINAVGTGNWIDFDSFALKGELVSKTEADKSAEDDNVSEETFGIVLYWAPSDVDNNYNMNNGEKTVLDITFGLNLFATQLTYEEDSFDDQYDAGAYLPVVYTEAELKSALENNESVQLGGNIELTGTWTPIGDKDAGIYYTGTLDGNGYTISGLSVTEGDYVSLISAAKDATIKNLTVEGTVVGDNAAGIVARVEGNTVIENCVSNVTVKGTTKAGGIACNVTNSEKTVFINCRNTGNVSGGDNGIGGIVGYVNNNAYVEIIDCVNKGDVTSNNNKYAGAAVGYAAGTSKGLVVNMTNTGTINGTVLNDGRYLKSGDTVLCGYVGTVGNWIYSDLAIASAEQLFAFAADVNGGNSYSGKTVVLTADIDLAGMEWTPIGQTGATEFKGIFDGQGYTIKNMTIVNNDTSKNCASGLFGWIESHGENITIKNVKFDNANVTGNHNVGVVVGYIYGSIENCEVKNSTVIGLNANDDANGDKVGAIAGYVGDANINNNKVENCVIKGNRDVGGLAGVVHNGVLSFTNNSVTNTTVYYETERTYASAGALFSGRIDYTADASNTTENTMVLKLAHVSSAAELNNLIATAAEGTTIQLAPGTYEGVKLEGTIAKNLTIVGTEGAVVKGIHGVKGTAQLKVVGLTLKNIDFQDKGLYFDCNGTPWNYVENLTMTGCTFVGTGTDDTSVGNRLFDVGSDSPQSNQYFNIVIESCTVSNALQGMRLGGVAGNGNKVVGNTITNIGHNAITVRSTAASGAVLLVEGNTISNGGDRAFRIGTNYGTITYKNNVITNCGDSEDGSNFKANTLGTVYFEGNTVDGVAWNPLA